MPLLPTDLPPGVGQEEGRCSQREGEANPEGRPSLTWHMAFQMCILMKKANFLWGAPGHLLKIHPTKLFVRNNFIMTSQRFLVHLTEYYQTQALHLFLEQ